MLKRTSLSRAVAMSSLTTLILTSAATAAFADGKATTPPSKIPQKTQVSPELNKVEKVIHFDFDKSNLDPQSQAVLDDVVTWASENPNREIVLSGQADAVGTEAYNYNLGAKRALSAREYLMSKGIPKSRISLVTLGESQADKQGRDPDARIVVFLANRPEGAQDLVTGEVDSQGDATARVDLDTGNIGMDEDMEGQEEAPTEVTVNNYDYDVPPAPATVDDYDDDRPSHLLTPAGMSVKLGGGIQNFVDGDARDFTDPAGTWGVAIAYGTRFPIGVEAAYVGSAQDVNALGLDNDNAILLGTMGEAALRVNIPVIPVIQPYLLGGVGVTNYRVVNENFNTSSIDDSDTSFHFPLGVGVGFRAAGFLLDLRGMYRPTFNDGLTNAPEDEIGDQAGDPVNLDSWAATASVGVEF